MFFRSWRNYVIWGVNVLELIFCVDNLILDFFENINNGVLTPVMKLITHLGDGGFLWIVIGVIMLCFKRTRKCGVIVLLSLLFCAVVALGIMKPYFGRVRPYLERGLTPLIPPPGGSSFPSGHTSSSFAAAFSICLYDKKIGRWACVMASLIAFSRLYFLVHYPTDILGGIIVGMLSAVIVSELLKKINIFKEK